MASSAIVQDSLVYLKLGDETENLSHYRDESSERSCRSAWRHTERCALAVDRICLLPCFGSLCSTVHQPHKE
jgi:hypothetical protein